MTQLRNIFQASYNSEAWKALISELFPNRDLYLTPQVLKDDELTETQKKEANEIRLFGEIKLKDDSCIRFYEVELKDGKKVIRNRVGLRNILHTNVIPGYVDGVFVSYYSKKTSDWRVTFISKSLYWDEENKQVKTETHPKRYTYVFGETEKCSTAIERFSGLLSQVSNGLTIEDLLKAFSVEKISDEFFKGYKHQFEKFVAFIEESENKKLFYIKGRTFETKDEEKEYIARSIRNWVKKFQGRIVFLYFLQKKGWLGVTNDDWGNGPKNFMRLLFDGFDNQINFYEKCLAELFFNTLNRDRNDNNNLFEITGTQVPFLNGGLFDKEINEPVKLKFKPEDVNDLFAFFDQYNFTIDENSPDDQDVGVDPEMLGLIFENLLEENRKKTGAFYTPKEVVHFMCRESLSRYLQFKLNTTLSTQQQKILDDFIKGNILDTPAFIKEKSVAKKIDDALTEVKICDPAIGSGAFPMGLVFEIIRLKRELFPFIGKNKFDYQKEKLSIIQNSIYGVDIDKGAVDIARLRFWLSLIVDEEVPSPLPNLDYKIMQGNSLLESFETWSLDVIKEDIDIEGSLHAMAANMEIEGQIKFSDEQKENLQKLVNDFFDPANHSIKTQIQDEIDELIHGHINVCYENEQRKIEDRKDFVLLKIATAKKTEAKTDKQKELKKAGIDKLTKDLKAIEKEQKQNDKIKEKLDKVQETEERPYFLWHLMFKEVFDKGGFDIVIGNPPYGVSFDLYKTESYKLGSSDSYGAFTSMAIRKLLKINGILSFIVSDTWLTIVSHKQLREQVLNWQLNKVIRLHIDCFKATVNSCIFTLTKVPAKSNSEHNLIAADLTNISTRKDIPLFRDRLFKLEENINISTPQFAVYQYHQSLINQNSNKPIFVASPKLFGLMNDTDCEKAKIKIDVESGQKEIEIRKIELNQKQVGLFRFGEIAEVKQGLATGDNEYYLYQKPEARGTYKDINLYKEYLLTEKDLNVVRENEKIRLKVIENGLHKKKSEKPFDKDLWFEGRYIIPHDKGGESDVDAGWLPNYLVPTNYFIDWSQEAVARIKNLKGKDGRLISRFQNVNYYFKPGLDYSQTGIYCPTFRINSTTVFNTEATSIFSHVENYFLLGVLCSKLTKFLIKNFIDSTVHASADKIKEIPITSDLNDKRISNLVIKIITQQKKENRYNYLANEQVEIDKLIYQIYGLDLSDIYEVETWFARKYPKLAKYAIIIPIEKLDEVLAIRGSGNKCETHKELIGSGENKRIEFKSTLRWDIRAASIQKHIEHSVGKTIAAFLNSEGGTLFIGVDDESKILGLDNDFNTFKGSNKKDEFSKHFDNLIQNYFGNHYTRLLSLEFCEIDGKTIAVIDISQKAPEPVYLKDGDKEIFYIRRFSSTKDLTIRETVSYIKEHWV